MSEDSEVTRKRRAKLDEIRASGVEPYSDDFRATTTVERLVEQFGALEEEELGRIASDLSLAGRVMALRNFGRAVFFHIKDGTGSLQAFAGEDSLGVAGLTLFKKLDLGDIVGVRGGLFRTKTGELTLRVASFVLLTKSIRPLPEKWHGLTDVEARYRQRYLDLLVNPAVKRIFVVRNQVISFIRKFLTVRGYLEVETPMMHQTPGGAAARPFVTHHNALETDLYLRIAPELYLKRLLVGGLDRVFEINRNFRNEGLSSEHNPEFTMLEFYQAYADYHDMMAITEEMVSSLAKEVVGSTSIRYQGREINFTPPWERITLTEALVKFAGLDLSLMGDRERIAEEARGRGVPVKATDGRGKIMATLFEKLVTDQLIRPTFVVDYPTEVSPLAKRCRADPDLVERFELFIAGKEIANAFSELTDPQDQRDRFMEQLRLKEGGEEEVFEADFDFIRALEYGMPPAGGEGMGIDRLVMILTDSPSIRDVILFPQLRPERTEG